MIGSAGGRFRSFEQPGLDSYSLPPQTMNASRPVQEVFTDLPEDRVRHARHHLPHHVLQIQHSDLAAPRNVGHEHVLLSGVEDELSAAVCLYDWHSHSTTTSHN